MDTLGHGLWSFIIFYRSPYRWWAFLIGMLPDIITFVPHYLIEHLYGGHAMFDIIYKITHSLVILLIFVGVFYFIVRKIPYIAGAWGLHTVFDIFTHPASGYPTPYMYPFTSPTVWAVTYKSITFTVINYILIGIAFLFLYYRTINTTQTK